MKKNIILLLSVLILCGSCSDFLDLPPKNTKVVYTMADVREAMSLFLYATISSSADATYSKYVMFNGEVIQYPFTRRINVASALYTNDLDLTDFLNSDGLNNENRGGLGFKTEYRENKNWEGYSFAERVWGEVFNNIGYLNMVLKDLEGVPDYNKTDYERILGEARVIRAYYLLRLNQLFAPYDNDELGIPFNFDADIIQGRKRWKQADLYKKLIGEIMDVLEYETSPKESWNIFFNKRIMYAILAQTYQYKASSCAAEDDDWSKAEYYAKEARGNGVVESTIDEQRELTATTVSPVVNKPHRFALLRISLYDSGPNDYSPWGRPDERLMQYPSDELYQLYDKNDIRREVYFKEEEGKVYFVKCVFDPNEKDANCSHVLFRYSDLLLIEAEALARQGKDGALDLLNEFKRSKIPGYAGYSGNDVIGEILKERRKEFVLEEEMNWIDMKRTGVKVTRLAKDEATEEIKSYTLESNDYRYTLPIPAEIELQYNNIQQNPGWK